MTAMNLALPPSQMVPTLKEIFKARLVPIVRASPGVGKSDIIRAIAKEAGLYLIDIRLSQADVVDLNGFPIRQENGKAAFMPFEHFPLEGDKVPEGYRGWFIFFDELTSAPKQIQAAAYKVLLDREIGNHTLHENVVMAAAGNLDSDRAVTHEISTALQSRLIHLELAVNLRDWMDWAISHGIDSRIMAFLEWKSELLHSFDPEHNDHTYACPRTWEFVNRLIQRKTLGMEHLPLLAGTISQGPALEFITFTQIYASLPKINDIINDPMGTPMPAEISTKFALATKLAEDLDDQNAQPLITYLLRMPIEFQVICMRIAVNRMPSLQRNKSVMQFWQSLLSYL